MLKIELFEIEQFICIKLDLGLNNMQWLICHKSNQTKRDLKLVLLASVSSIGEIDVFEIIFS